MKNLHSFIEESIYDNLGISDDIETSYILDWVKELDTFKRMLDPFKSPRISEVMVHFKQGPWGMPDSLFKKYKNIFDSDVDVLHKILTYDY